MKFRFEKLHIASRKECRKEEKGKKKEPLEVTNKQWFLKKITSPDGESSHKLNTEKIANTELPPHTGSQGMVCQQVRLTCRVTSLYRASSRESLGVHQNKSYLPFQGVKNCMFFYDPNYGATSNVGGKQRRINLQSIWLQRSYLPI